MENNIDINSIIQITQMPKLFTQLELIGEEVKKALDGIDNIKCTDENKAEVKKRKQEITKFKNLMEDKRKEIKMKLLADYEIFNIKYQNEVKEQLDEAENKLNAKISEIETKQKQKKEKELRRFAKEHFEANEIQDIVKFEQIGLNITLNASEKSLKEQVIAFCKKVKNDIDAILLEEYKDEILIEYKNYLNYAQAKTIVIERHKKLEETKKYLDDLDNHKIHEDNNYVVIEDEPKIEKPKEINNNNIGIWVPDEEELEILEVSFLAYGTKDQLIGLKKYMQENDIKFEEVNE